MRLLELTVAVGLWMLVAWGCSGPPSTPEQQVKDTLRFGEEAAERRDIGALAELVADGYQDDNGYDRRALLQLAQAYLMGHHSIHLLLREQSIELVTPQRAEVAVLVAMAGEPLESADQLINVRADLFKFEIVFVRTGNEQWQVASAGWHRAGVDDFF
ncbi:MAG: hypothetical protein OEQ18_04220 [Gammaproteobacteria bacterium]|nr:hypothetical protein [Gammaproteobacteria bacterium]